MAKKASPKLIGGFVIGAIALAVVGILAFGGGAYFAHTRAAVLYFQGSLSGLQVGAPVTFRGVRVGSVTKIVIHYDVLAQKLAIPVFIEINPDDFQIVHGTRGRTNIDELVQRGLRAQLQIESLVTGQASVNFDFHPDTPIHLVAGTTSGVQELPTVPSSIEVLQTNLENLLGKMSKLPLEQMSSQLLQAGDNVNQVLKESLTVVTGAGVLIGNLGSETKPLARSVNGLLQELQQRLELREGEPMQNLNMTLVSMQKLVDRLNEDLPRVIGPAAQSLARLSSTLEQALLLVQAAQRVISPGSPLYFELTSTLSEFKSAARAMRVFAEYIQRNPNSLLVGNK
jgi:paraquat-inducible protein B